ncbi:thiolase [Alicycliphilus denitrificans]|uniref:acetyl-CoA acetyltransferase n=1 Tax=Alicycliphilus denitrificans TaxID=179636 RepID=UPI000960C570|nr:acetyl-CoA acetyltransferase [Alicycliphilus denitrificans]MBN9573128.1 thiolase [Alicycliphilus denitrificans]OJW93249.1 MAG: thiolase [Alicycliphilus sp. 69-12]BCN36902.1 thiolase [Alicycliphilus denitrificans]
MNKELSGSVAIVGAAESDLGKVPGMTALEMQAQASLRALNDAGLRLQDVDGVFAHTDDRFAGLQLAEYLGIRPSYIDSTNVGGMSNILHVGHAMAAIAAGMCSVALVTYGSTQLSSGTRKVGGAFDGARSPVGQFISPYGQLNPIGYYAMAANLHMHRYGTTSEQLAEVAVAARKWAQLNPKAYRTEPLSIEDVLSSPLVADPLRSRDICLVTDAGGAFILTTADRAKDLRRPPVYVLGIAEAFSHHYTPFSTADWLDTGVARTGEAALGMAGLTRNDIDVVQIYDHFTIGVIQALEELGFCKRGEGGAFVAGGRLGPDGDFPINTSGGGLSFNHPGMFGMLLVLEAVHQLRQEAGRRQLPKARTALVHAPGMVFSANTTMILGVQ